MDTITGIKNFVDIEIVKKEFPGLYNAVLEYVFITPRRGESLANYAQKCRYEDKDYLENRFDKSLIEYLFDKETVKSLSKYKKEGEYDYKKYIYKFQIYKCMKKGLALESYYEDCMDCIAKKETAQNNEMVKGLMAVNDVVNDMIAINRCGCILCANCFRR